MQLTKAAVLCGGSGCVGVPGWPSRFINAIQAGWLAGTVGARQGARVRALRTWRCAGCGAAFRWVHTVALFYTEHTLLPKPWRQYQSCWHQLTLNPTHTCTTDAAPLPAARAHQQQTQSAALPLLPAPPHAPPAPVPPWPWERGPAQPPAASQKSRQPAPAETLGMAAQLPEGRRLSARGPGGRQEAGRVRQAAHPAQPCRGTRAGVGAGAGEGGGQRAEEASVQSSGGLVRFSSPSECMALHSAGGAGPQGEGGWPQIAGQPQHASWAPALTHKVQQVRGVAQGMHSLACARGCQA